MERPPKYLHGLWYLGLVRNYKPVFQELVLNRKNTDA